jgi:hypothetical protein
LNQQTLQKATFEAQLITDSVKTGDPDQAAVNLEFLVQSGLLSGDTGVRVREYLERRQPETGRALPARQEAVREQKNLLRNRLIGPYFRMFSTNSPAIRSQTYENLPSNSRFLATVPILGQPPSWPRGKHINWEESAKMNILSSEVPDNGDPGQVNSPAAGVVRTGPGTGISIN